MSGQFQWQRLRGMTRSRSLGLTCLALWLVGCTSLQTHGLDRIGPGLPIDPGDEIKLYLIKNPAQKIELKVGSIDDNRIHGTLLNDPGEAANYRWDEILQIEAREFDAGKTTLGVTLLLILVGSAVELVDDLQELFGMDDD